MTRPALPRARSTIRAQAGRVQIDLLTEVDPDYGFGAVEVMEVLRSNPGAPVNLSINSPGGCVWTAFTVYELLRNHTGHVRAEVLGLAASAASFIAMAADEITIAPTGSFMIHDAAAMAWGQAADLRATADLLDEVSTTIAAMYARRAGGDPRDWRAAMLAESWFHGQAAVDAGLADRVAEPVDAPTAAARVARRVARRENALTLPQAVRAGLSSALRPPPRRVRARLAAPSAMPVIRALRSAGARPRGVVR